jgi:hypothetical protein
MYMYMYTCVCVCVCVCVFVCKLEDMALDRGNRQIRANMNAHHL